MSALSPRDTKVLNYLRKTITDAYCPTFQQIGDATGLASKSQVSGALESLRQKGWIKRDSYSPRAIQLVDPLSERSTADLMAMRDRIDRVLAGRAQ